MPTIVTAKLTETDVEEIATARDKVLISSRLNCFKIHNGIRPSEFSVIVGPAGNGKSALIKSIAVDASISGVNSLIVLSEEKTSVYKSNINKTFARTKTPDVYLERIFLTSLLEWKREEKNERSFYSYIEEVINEKNIDVVLFDNYTTSFFGRLHIDKQGEAIDEMRNFAAAYDIAFVSAFHTVKGTDIYSKLVDGEDVRGNSTATNQGSYNYILTTYFNATPIRAVLRIDKARYHLEANKTFWELNYDNELQLYTGAKKITSDDNEMIIHEVKERIRERQKQSKGVSKW